MAASVKEFVVWENSIQPESQADHLKKIVPQFWMIKVSKPLENSGLGENLFFFMFFLDSQGTKNVIRLPGGDERLHPGWEGGVDPINTLHDPRFAWVGCFT